MLKYLIATNQGSVLFNEAFNTFYLWLYDIEPMVKNHLDSEIGNPLPIGSKGFFYIYHITERMAHTMNYAKPPVVEHWLEREIAQCTVQYIIILIGRCSENSVENSSGERSD